MHLTVHVLPGRTREAEAVIQAAREAGVELRPLHPGVDDPLLAGMLGAQVADAEAARRAAERLRAHPAVDAAYLKPADELP